MMVSWLKRVLVACSWEHDVLTYFTYNTRQRMWVRDCLVASPRATCTQIEIYRLRLSKHEIV
jgi:hypothetical protein